MAKLRQSISPQRQIAAPIDLLCAGAFPRSASVVRQTR
jgi:hypothetical protein